MDFQLIFSVATLKTFSPTHILRKRFSIFSNRSTLYDTSHDVSVYIFYLSYKAHQALIETFYASSSGTLPSFVKVRQSLFWCKTLRIGDGEIFGALFDQYLTLP